MKITDQRAIWVDRHTLAWPTQSLPQQVAKNLEWRLTWSVRADIEVDARSVGGRFARSVEVLPDLRGLGPEVVARHPQLAGYLALRLPQEVAAEVAHLLTCELVVSQHTTAGIGSVLDATGVQIALVLDAEFAERARTQRFGVQVGTRETTVRVWAPTALDTLLLMWPPDGQGPPQEHPLHRDSAGSWSVAIPTESARDAEYLFRVTVYAPSTGRVETNLVTDPYSVGLTRNSQRSVVVDLDDPAWTPAVWRDSDSPALTHPVDQGLYELHIRDFSLSDDLVPESHRGTYLAFGDAGHGRAHLTRLAAAGLTSIELLPTFDFATVNEDPSAWVAPAGLDELPPDSAWQQRIIMRASHNPFNWGYDPLHWMAPEGSYATGGGARGAERSAQFRSMVGNLHQMGLRVVLDQVFNHTAASGQHPHSVLDRIVPGYYHRLDARGVVCTSTCCANVATERPMVERLMVDACVHWARAYRVDGFRFDLMGHSSVDNLLAVREALDALTLDRDGVDGRGVTLHGEGWNFGEVADHRLFRQATQGSLAGSGIATFSDRLRDAVRGGGPMSSDPRLQGFGSGVFTAPNGVPVNRTAEPLAHATDLLALGLAGTLASYRLRCSDGTIRRGDELLYTTVPAGYASEPVEVINYVDAHDNETLWDALLLKLEAGTPMAERIRMNTLCLATATLAQSPFLWHAGSDLLRSKSLDRNSYNHGDWFNRLDWTGADNGFGRGLPPKGDNHHHWRHQSPLLRQSELKPSVADVAIAAAGALDLLRLRASTRLFRLGTATLIDAKVAFPALGTPDAIPGVLVLAVDDTQGPDIDPALDSLVAVFNASPHAVEQSLRPWAGRHLELSPVQLGGSDPIVKAAAWDADSATLRVPARSVAVFVEPQRAVNPPGGQDHPRPS